MEPLLVRIINHLVKHCILYVITADDYSAGPYNVTFPAGKTNATFNIELYDDNIFEKNETFKLTIDENSHSAEYPFLKVNPFVFTFIITDDDGT